MIGVEHRLTIAASIVLLGCSADVSAEDCAWDYIHHSGRAPVDAGQGHVLTRDGHSGYHSPNDAWGAEEVLLQDCRTGVFVRVRTEERDDRGNYAFDASDAIDAYLAEMPPEASGTWVQALAERARAVGAAIRFEGTSDEESCGCRAFYPDLRGGKKQYEGAA